MPSRLSARPIVNFQNVNSFKYANQWTVSAGNSNTLYFQLVDLDQCGLRYLAGIGSGNIGEIIKKRDGEIEIETELNKGTRVSVNLPA